MKKRTLQCISSNCCLLISILNLINVTGTDRKLIKILNMITALLFFISYILMQYKWVTKE